MNSHICWNSTDDEILINFVRNHEILYNVKNKDYRKTQLKQNLWFEVGNILNKSDIDCYKRWCYVRDYYIRRKGKPGICSIGEAAKKRSDLLSFLDTLPSAQRHSNNAIEDENSRENIQEQTFTQEFPTYQEIEDTTFSEGNNSLNNYTKEDSTEEDNKECIEHDSSQKRKHNSHSRERLNLLKQLVRRQLSGQNEFDENDLFFSSMAKIVKKLPRHEQAQLRMQIGTLIGNAELRCVGSQKFT